VGEVTPIDPRGLTMDQKIDAVLLQGVQLHGCLEQHIAETRLAHLTATEARQKLEGKVDDLADAVGALDTRQDITEGSVSALAKSLGAQLTGPREVKVRAPVSWKDIGKIVLSVLGAIGGLIFIYQALAATFPAFHHYVMSLSPT